MINHRGKSFIGRPGGPQKTQNVEELLPPLPDPSMRYKGTYLMDRTEAFALKVLLAEVLRDTGVTISMSVFVRVGIEVLKPRLEALAQAKRQLTAQELYDALLHPPAPAE